jgi:uncharacterized membrane protein YGL010W
MLISGVENYAEYLAYHRNKVNVWIHIVCVPMIVFSLLLGGLAFPLNNAHLLPFLPSLKDTLLPHPVVLGLMSFLVLYSFLLEPFLGLLFDLEVIGMYLAGKHIVETYGHTNALYVAIGFHVVSWIIQFIGHGAFEKRAPALLTNILQMAVAPTFVILEVLFMFGYRPSFHKSIQYSSKKYMPKKAN